MTRIAMNGANTKSGKWATFVLAGDVFALPVDDVQEVLMQQVFSAVPLAPNHILGLLHLRGQVLTAMDLRCLLGFPPREPEAGSKVFVVRASTGFVSLEVDEAGDVFDLPEDAWEPTPDTMSGAHKAFLLGICPIDGQILLGFDLSKLTPQMPVLAAIS